MGPAAKVAFDAAGQPTRALLGFCAGKGVDPSAVRRVETPKGEYVVVTVHHAGRPAAEVLPAMLAQAAPPLQFPERCDGTRATTGSAARCAGWWRVARSRRAGA
jgi:glycyl-tRNA synthetase beta chain